MPTRTFVQRLVWLLPIALLASCSASGTPLSDIAPDAWATSQQQKLMAIESHLNSMIQVDGPRTVTNTLAPYNEVQILLGSVGAEAWSLSELHPDESMRKTAADLGLEIDAMYTELSLRRDVYEALAALPTTGLDDAEQRVLELTLRDYKRSGIDRDETTREQIRALNKEIAKLSQEFGKNISDDVRTVVLDSVRDLDGLPKDFIDTHPAGEDGKIRITTAYPDALPVLSNATNPDVRRRIYLEFYRRAHPQNQEVLTKMLKARHELAQLLGYENWAEYATETMMIGSGRAIERFINKIAAATRERAAREQAELLAEKQREVPDATELHAWDSGFYSNRLRKRKYSFDSQQLRPYFEFNRVKDGILELYAELFELEMTKVDVEMWHDSVETYDVRDSARGGRPLGRFYLDLHPRQGKFTHAAMFGWRTGIKDRQLPEAILVCNFPDPSKSPALMDHGQVVTFFHEFGHLLDALFAGHSTWARISGGVDEWDFVEAPSQMLEEWIHDPTVLARFSRHYQTGEPIPASLVEAAGRARTFGRGVGTLQQLFYSALSYRYHAQDPAQFNVLEMLKKTQGDYTLRPYVEGTYLHSSFGHLSGYTSNYYTYMWSLVIARDLLSRFEGPDGKLDLLNKSVARRYREKILEPGGTKSANELVEDFLGRPYSSGAFERWLKE